ncbi:MAG: Na+/H+ antiporter subunit A [Tetrasphaera sp.]
MEIVLLVLLLAHAVAGALAPALVRWWGRWAFVGLAIVPGSAAIWAGLRFGAARSGTVVEQLTWVPQLHLDLTLRLAPLPRLMTLIVGGVGALVLGYCAWYFTDDEPGLGLLAGSLTAFAGAMLGLVWADNLLILYVFWELTTILSFLLIGHDPTKRAARVAATQALIVTTFGGLAMLVGILLLGARSGSYSVSALLANPPAPTATVSVAVILLLLGAISKSALFPFHFWLPGAMAAPTPVSAYLHAAAMVKAGVFLVALLAPALAPVPGWHLVLGTLGAATMILGGWRSLRQYDLKLLLAYGTVSQLGFLLAVLGIGTRAAALAGLAMMLAHALFKAALFLIVGIIDHHAGTRDLRKLTGLRHRMPVVAVAAGLAAGSMAGIPVLLGFVGKESVWAALATVAAEGDGTDLQGGRGWLLLAALVLGSALTVAYSARFLWGAFADRPQVQATATPVPVGFWLVPAVLAGAGLVLGFLGAALTRLVGPYIRQFPPGAHDEPLALWHGLGLPLLLSGVAVLAGLVLFATRHGFARFQGAISIGPNAERAYQSVIRATERLAIEVTGFTQRGSLTVYLGVALVVVVLVPGYALTQASGAIRTTWFDTPLQVLLGLLIAAAAVVTVRSRRRLRAVILAGVTGYGTALLFLVHGAPDLALTQLLVETVSLVVSVLVLRRLPPHFTERPLLRARYWRMLIAAAFAVAVAGFLLVSAGSRTVLPPTTDLVAAAVDFGSGYNIVNVTLVDVRAWDTFGEISVLLVAATGVASLLFIDTRIVPIRRVHEIPYPEGVDKLPTRPGRRAWLPAPRTLAPEKRSIVFEVVTRLLFHTILVVSVYLLFAGHNHPGGGFAGGLVAGTALVVRYLAGGRYELDEAAPVDAGIVLGLGLFVSAVAALAPLAFDGHVLQSFTLAGDLPLLGQVKLVSSLFFDIGVYLVVFGLMLDLLRSLGGGIDRHIRREQRAEQEGAS